MQLFNASPKLGFVEVPLYYYFQQNSESIVTCNNVQIKIINNAKHCYNFLIERNEFEEYRSDFACLAMQLKIAVLHDLGIGAARALFPYAHHLRQAYRMSSLVSWIYWFAFNGGDRCMVDLFLSEDTYGKEIILGI